jgi:hypothetical protein
MNWSKVLVLEAVVSAGALGCDVRSGSEMSTLLSNERGSDDVTRQESGVGIITSVRDGGDDSDGSGSPTPLVLATGGFISALAIDAADVYWLEAYGNFYIADSGNLWSVPKVGGSSSRLISEPGGQLVDGAPPTPSPLDGARCVAADETGIYWGNSGGGGTIWKMPAGGGVATVLCSGTASRVALDVNNLYWTDAVAGAVMKVGKQGGNPTALASGLSGPQALAVDVAAVYWTNIATGGQDGTIAMVAKGGGATTTLATAQFRPTAIAVDAANVYWANSGDGNSNGSVMRVPLAGGTPTILASAEQGPSGIAVDATSIYWTTDTALRRVGVDGGSNETLVVQQAVSGTLTADGTSLYWAEWGASAGGGDCSVLKLVLR